jgi:two-component system, LytTR family, sensor kinase
MSAQTSNWLDVYSKRAKVWLLIFAIATTLALVYAVRNALGSIAVGRPIDWVWGVGFEFTYWFVWAAYTPAVLWVANRFPLDRTSRARFVAIMFSFGLIIAFCQSATEWGVALAIEYLRRVPADEFARRLGIAKRNIPLGTFGNLVIFSLIIGAHYGYVYYRGFRNRQLHSAELEALLARADLQNLKAQLQPHFLFNTLNTISVLMRRDPVAANQTLVHLSDLLRMSLNNVSAQETSLREEMEFLDGYLEIEQTRFHDRLSVRRSIQTETLNAAVPNLILQPLVENALKHGIAKKPGPGTIEICASRNNSRLQLEIKDDGPGIAGERVDGVGLAITKRRLQRLYGAQQQFGLREGTHGGVVATVIIPFRTYEHH